MTEQDRRGENRRDQTIDRLIAEVEGDLPTPPHAVPRRTLDSEEQEIRDALLRMGRVVQQAIETTVVALETQDGISADGVVAGDARVNAQASEALELVVRTIATQAPVARDLRFLLTLDHIAFQLERIGDSAANVAKRVRELALGPLLEEYVGIPEMGRLAAASLSDVLRALTSSDAELARAVAARDDDIDDLYHRATERLVALAREDGTVVDSAARLLLAAHYMERIGDHVVNIAEDVVFLVTGTHEDLNA